MTLNRMYWHDAIIHVMDFEGHRRYGVIEYGVVTLRGGEITTCETRLCRSQSPISPGDSAIHGLFDRDTIDAPPFKEAFERFVEWRRCGVFAAHNKSVEHALLKHTWPYPPFVPDWRTLDTTRPDWGPWIDTLRIYQTLYPTLTDHSLGALLSTFNLEQPLLKAAAKHCPPRRRQPHCALYDALASALLLVRLQAVPETAAASLAQLLLWSGERLPQEPELFGPDG